MDTTNRSAKLDLFLVSFLALFLELVFIRWAPSYERVLAYFTNFVLIASFLGLGLGSMLARWKRDLLRWQPLLILALVVVGILFNLHVATLGSQSDIIYSEGRRPAWLRLNLPTMLIFFFLIITLEFVPLGQRIGKGLMDITPPLSGYMVNLLGSLLGVVAFAAISFWQLAPVWWFAVAGLLLLWFVRREPSRLVLNGVVGAAAALAVYIAGAGFIWSPYHKLVTTPLVFHHPLGVLMPYKEALNPQDATVLPDSLGFHIAVDDDFLQMALNLSDESLAKYPFLTNYRSQYDLAYYMPGVKTDNVLIVGAGTGNDTAAALRHGARHVDAVEIDPAIVNLGRGRHPEHPYDDPRVRVIVDDARSFFNRTERKYDLIVFGLLDAHRLFSSMSSVRLDSFVFTVESFREVRRLLKDDGLAVVEHGLGALFMGDRMFAMLEQAFEMQPRVATVEEFPGVTFLVGPLANRLDTQRRWDIGDVELATDDWPFFYLEGPKLPGEYRTALIAMFTIAVILVFIFSKGKIARLDLHFFFLGSAFLLIETLSVTRFAMLFGSTWAVNSIVFTAILIVVLLANLWMHRITTVNTPMLYALLAASVLLNYWFPVSSLLRVDLVWRLAAAMLLMGAPIFVAAFIFARSFKSTHDADQAYASNLLGAVVGGLVEYTTLVIGFRNQLLIALAMYLLSAVALYAVTRRRAVLA